MREEPDSRHVCSVREVSRRASNRFPSARQRSTPCFLLSALRSPHGDRRRRARSSDAECAVRIRGRADTRPQTGRKENRGCAGCTHLGRPAGRTGMPEAVVQLGRLLCRAERRYIDSKPTCLDMRLAAHLNRNQHLLRRYIELNINKGEPAAIARALMVAGFSDRSQSSGNILDKHRATEGFVGATCEAARYAYDRNLWARHWFRGMCRASDVKEFWRCSVLFLKVVDGRYDFWFPEYGDRSEAMHRFWPNLRASLNNRVKKWRRNHESKLFGADRPNGVFIPSNRQQ